VERTRRWLGLVVSALLLLIAAAAQAQPSNLDALFFHKSDGRRIPEKWLNAIGVRTRDVGRSFALVVGVWDYPNLPPGSRTLDPAEKDVTYLTRYLKDYEYFDEIVVLANRNFTEENLRYFLQDHFPAQLAASPGARFLFAFTGHGFNVDRDGFLLHPQARSFTDERNSLAMASLHAYLGPVIRTNAKVGVLINACSSGDFVSQVFGESDFIFEHPGAHAITASGAGQKSLHIGQVGPGSVFFETLLGGLTKGYADTYPPARDGNSAGDGIVSMREAFGFLEPEVTRLTNRQQLPKWGDLRQSNYLGSFYFFNQRVQTIKNRAPAWDPATVVAFGEGLHPDIRGLKPALPPAPVALAPPPVKVPEPPARAPDADVKRAPTTYIVFFDYDSSTLGRQAMITLGQAAGAYFSLGISTIEVTGHTDASRPAAYSVAESMRRAVAVQQALIKLGVPADAIMTSAKGKTELMVMTPDGVREPQNRRAEIVLRYPTSFSVFFDYDSSTVGKQAMITLEQAVAAYFSSGLTTIEVIGHTDTARSTTVSDAESMRRATAVKDALIGLGVPAEAIMTSGRGKTDPLVPTPDGVREPQNRRAQITLQ